MNTVTYGPYTCPQCQSTDPKVCQEHELAVARLQCQVCHHIDTFAAFSTRDPLWDTFTEAKDPNGTDEDESDDPLPDDDFPPMSCRCPKCNSDSIIGVEQSNGTKLARCLDCGTVGYYYQFYLGDRRHPFTANTLEATL